MPHEAVTIGDLFTPDDEIGVWVFALSAATEDLAIAERTFRDELDADQSVQRVGYHLRQLIARIYEAERPIVALKRHAEARAFVESLPDCEEALAFLRSVYEGPLGGKSTVRETFGEMRHLTVHHAWVGSPELREALTLAADEEARFVIN